MRAHLLTILLVIALVTAYAPAASSQIAVSGCRGDMAPAFEPVSDGPLRLRRITCSYSPSSLFPRTPTAVSPDGNAIARFVELSGLYAVALGGHVDLPVYPASPRSTNFARMERTGRSAFQWDVGSQAIWTATQDRVVPNGWAAGPVRPVLAHISGTVELLPEPRRPAGPLDALLWIDGRGLALAQFGTRGSYYRPEHADPAPTFAYLDAQEGRVLDSLPLAEIVEPDGVLVSPAARVQDASAVVMADGRPRSFIVMEDWVVWTLGEEPRRLPNPYPPHTRHVLSPDGERVVVTPPFPSESYCPRVPPCHVGPAMSGVVAALHDVRTGNLLWTLEGRSEWGNIPLPAFSPDGGHVLIGMPVLAGESYVAVVEVRGGRVVQRLNTFEGTNYAIGFAADGEQAWVSANGVVALYDVEPVR
jgi:hypothetical protein